MDIQGIQLVRDFPKMPSEDVSNGSLELACSVRAPLLMRVTVWLLVTAADPLSAQSVPTAFAPSGIAGGGYMLNAAVNPADSSNLLLGCDMMGLYRSTTKGRSWRLVPSEEFSVFRRGELQFAGGADSQRVYGLQRFRWDSEGTVPAMSVNRGLTWQALGVPAEPSAANAYYGLAVDPGSATAATQRMVMDNWRKLWFSADGGATWTLIHEHPGATGPGVPSSIRLAGAFWDEGTIYVGTNLGVFVSLDYGSTWMLAAIPGAPLRPQGGDPPALAPIVDFCGARHPDTGVVTLFATFLDDVAENNADVRQLDEFTHDYLGLYTVTLNASPSWTLRLGPGGEKFARVDVCHTDSTRPWAVTKHNDGQGPRIFKSNDGGLTWTNTFLTNNNGNITTGFQGDGGVFSWQYGAVSFGLDVSDADPNVVLVSGTWPYMTEDGGATWRQLFVNNENPAGSVITQPQAYRHTGLGVTTSHWMHWWNDATALVCSTDVGLQLTADGGRTWTCDHTPVDANGLVWSNWYAMAQQPGGTRLYAAVADINDFYEPERLDDVWANGHMGAVLVSTDGGRQWAGTGGNLPGPVVGLDVDPLEPTHVYAAVASSQNLPDAAGGIFRSTDLGASWARLATPPRTQGRASNIKVLGSGKLLATFCARTVNDEPQASSGVFYSSDGGATWQDRSHADMLYYTRDVAVVPSAPTTHWFVSVQSHVVGGDSFTRVYDGRGGVFRTTDSGTSWTRIFPHAANQPTTGVQSVTYVPGTAPLLYVTTPADGLWVSTDPDAAAPSFTKVSSFPFHRVRRVFVDPQRPPSEGAIWVTTQGGGLWRSARPADASAQLIRNGAGVDFRVIVGAEQSAPPELWASPDLSLLAGGWTLLSGIEPEVSTTLSGLTCYQWQAVNTHPFLVGLQRWFLRAGLYGAD